MVDSRWRALVMVAAAVLLCVVSGCIGAVGGGTPPAVDITATTGKVEGFIYITPAQAGSAGAGRQAITTRFVYSASENAELGQPAADGTRVSAPGGTGTTTGGFFSLPAVQVGLRTLTVTGPIDGQEATQELPGFLVVPDDVQGLGISVVVLPAALTEVPAGGTTQLTAELRAGSYHVAAYPASDFVWSSQSEAIATVDGSGTVAGVASGQARITAQTGPYAGSRTVSVEGNVRHEVGQLWLGALTSYLDNGHQGYNFREAALVSDPSASRGTGDMHMDVLGQVHAWGTGALSLGTSVALDASIVPPAEGYVTETLQLQVGEVAVIKLRD
ncbi:MAG TPA: Ig-like domain-containing protein, partial [Armatimonadota bacterium]|nr:Ig-like domain-containing protein [Armatimonadota bacterium]